MRIYTRRGDRGETGLYAPKGAEQRVRKDDVRVEAYGTIDELLAWIGLLAVRLEDGRQELQAIQQVLFHVGYDVATIQSPPPRTVTADDVAWLETRIDQITANLPEERRFLLPGGSEDAALLHIARTVCRRAERRVVTLAGRQPVNPDAVSYLNRLSDYLFVLARRVAVADGGDEVPVTWRF